MGDPNKVCCLSCEADADLDVAVRFVRRLLRGVVLLCLLVVRLGGLRVVRLRRLLHCRLHCGSLRQLLRLQLRGAAKSRSFTNGTRARSSEEAYVSRCRLPCLPLQGSHFICSHD